jgi:signal peptidase I
MDPAIKAGDQIILFKLPYKIPLIKKLDSRSAQSEPVFEPVVVSLPDKSAQTVLRIAAISGDSVNIDNAQFYRNGQPIENFHQKNDTHDIIPASYSPADFMAPFIIPSPGDSITFSELTLRDLIFAYSIFRQEKPDVRLKPFVLDDETTSSDYLIEDFSLYNGTIDSIPETLHADWFFWDKLQEYLEMTATDDKKPQLAFSVLKNDKKVLGFKVKKHYIFLIGDNWSNSKDSRYFGPVITTNIQGRPFITAWGFEVGEGEGEDGKKRLSANRIGKIVR